MIAVVIVVVVIVAVVVILRVGGHTTLVPNFSSQPVIAMSIMTLITVTIITISTTIISHQASLRKPAASLQHSALA